MYMVELKIDAVESVVRGDIVDDAEDEESDGVYTRTITVKYDGDKILVIALTGEDEEALKIKRAE